MGSPVRQACVSDDPTFFVIPAFKAELCVRVCGSGVGGKGKDTSMKSLIRRKDWMKRHYRTPGTSPREARLYLSYMRLRV